MSISALILLAVLASPALAQAPTVSLLIDLPNFASNGTLNLRSTLSAVSTRKGQSFHFGSTYETSYPDASYHANLYSTFFNHMVAEKSCKWQTTEPSPNVTSLTGCKGVQSFATSHGDSFRGHNTFWHANTPVSGFLCPYHGARLTAFCHAVLVAG
jgi:endo-1,4-beta-xylanase